MKPIRLITCLFATLASCLPFAAAADELDAQRQAFREVYPQVELGIWQMPAEREALLSRYVLWPDLRATWLKTQLRSNSDDDREVRLFLDTYADLKPARELRYRYALTLAKRRQWADFLTLYRAHYAALGVAKLDCLALRAELDTLPAAAQRERVTPLWLTAKSQAKECDPVFARLKTDKLLDEHLYRQRFALAIEAREYGMARYLARSLGEEFKQEARSWTRAYGEPRNFLDTHSPTQESERYREQLLSAVKRIAYNDPALAQTYWQEIGGKYAFTDGDKADADRHVALWLARNHHADAYRALNALSGQAVDDEVRRWRVRTALRDHHWDDVVTHIDGMSAAEQDSLQWRYWRGIALQKAGDSAALEVLAALADDRSYYGFLAADAIDRDYAFGHRDLAPDEKSIDALRKRPQLERAIELFMVGLDGRGRSEWDAAITAMTPQEQVQAAILAHRHGWHSRAIATAARNDQYDDLTIRYPMPYATQFDTYANMAGISPSWAFGIARSESLFMPDILSSAGAIGMMQLMPATGRLTAKELRFPFKGRVTLTDPVSNIRLGTWFLGNMHQRFANHPVLATAAYNAGPHRVEAWLPETSSLDARIWIETIPYEETRGYVRRVLTADTIFEWRMGTSATRLSTRLAPVLPLEQVAELVAQGKTESPSSSAND